MTTTDIHAERVLILDFGSQFSQLIARRVREIGVYSELLPCDISDEKIRNFKPAGIILSGGPESAIGSEALPIPPVVFDLGVPVFGICYGMQAMAAYFGGTLSNAGHSEFGHATVELLNNSGNALDKGSEEGGSLFGGITAGQGSLTSLDVWMSHGDSVSELPAGFQTLASSENAPIAAMECRERRLYGVQFHPEVTHTLQGKEILQHFLVGICGLSTEWTSGNIIEDALQSIREQVGKEEVILALSGGVDSSVVALLLHRAIGSQLTCVFVDNGLLRQDEGDQVMKTFGDNLGVRVIRVDAEERFLSKLAGIDDPEEKRKIIGAEFIAVFEEEAGKLTSASWLAQGTIYPDVIESATESGKAHLIKSHHNVGGLPEDMTLKLIEPLRELFKDEVRQLGIELGLPETMVMRHPFPGPGLAVRVLGSITREALQLLRPADAIFTEELYKHDLYQRVSQAFVVFLPVKSVGVTGDGRSYGYVVSLRAVETVDFMTAHVAALPHDFLDMVATRILNEVRGISRVVYDISSKPPATIEWE